MFRRFSGVAQLIILLALTTLAVAPMKSEAGTASVVHSRITLPRIPFEKYTLKNGLEVILSEDHRLPLVTVYVLYHVGPIDERPGLTGFAHLFEHFMFDGSLHVGEKAYFKTLEGVGAHDVNGTTDLDHTQYFETVPSNELATALWLESDRMGFLLDKLDGAKLANQRAVVRNELRQSIENQPYGLAELEVYHQLFPSGHPYYADVIGSHADIEAARISDVREFCMQYYSPNNASLAIVGDIDKVHAKELVDKYFAPLRSGKQIVKPTTITPPIYQERRAVITDKVELPRVYISWITNPIFTSGDSNGRVLAEILGGTGKSSRLYQKLVYDKHIAQDVTAEQTSLSLGSVFTIRATAKPGIKPEELEAVIDNELSNIQNRGPSQVEVDQARNMIMARTLRSLETVGGELGVAGRLSVDNHYLNDPGFLQKDISQYERVSILTLKSFAQHTLPKHSRVVLYCLPGPKHLQDVAESKVEDGPVLLLDEDRAAFLATQAWRGAPPTEQAALKVNLPVVQHFELANGLTVYFIERHDLPVVTLGMYVLSGNEANPPDKPGLAAFMTKMLGEGTKRRSALQISTEAERIGAEIVIRSIADWSGIQIRCLKQNLNTAFDLMSDVALNPAFRAADVERVRQDELASLLQDRENPSRIALKVFYHVAYGSNHPYGSMEFGTEESLKRITQEDLEQFWEKGYVPTNAVLAINGDVTESEVRLLAQKYFAAWKGKSETVYPTPMPSNASSKPTIVIVDRPGAPQTAMLVGGYGISRSSPDYVPTEVMNTVLGGLVSSRLNTNLREKNGYTYGIFSQFVYRREPGPFFARTSVRTDATAPALREVLKELDGIRTNPLTPDELASSKTSMIRSLPDLFETTQQTSRSIGDLFVYGLPLDYYKLLPAKIEAVDSAETGLMAKKHIDTGSMIVVLVGDRSRIEPGVRQLNLGPIEIRDANGNL